MDGQILLGREVTVVFAEENRKKPSEMRARERVGYCTALFHPFSLMFFVLLKYYLFCGICNQFVHLLQ
jgi:hypothetical protein